VRLPPLISSQGAEEPQPQVHLALAPPGTNEDQLPVPVEVTTFDAADANALRPDDILALREQALAFREDVRQRVRDMKTSKQLRDHDVKLRHEDSRVRREHARLRDEDVKLVEEDALLRLEDSRLREENSELRRMWHRALRFRAHSVATTNSSAGAVTPGFWLLLRSQYSWNETGNSTADKAATHSRHSEWVMLAISVIGVTLSFCLCVANEAYEFVYEWPTAEARSEDSHEDGHIDRRDVCRFLAKKVICLHLSPIAMRRLSLFTLQSAAVGGILWWKGLLQPVLGTLVVYAYLVAMVLWFLAVIGAQGFTSIKDRFARIKQMVLKLEAFFEGQVDDVRRCGPCTRAFGC